LEFSEQWQDRALSVDPPPPVRWHLWHFPRSEPRPARLGCRSGRRHGV